MDWAKALDFRRALDNCGTELIHDWYRDPWGWPELEWTVKKQSDLVLTRLNGDGAKLVCTIDVPKENYMIRPAMVIDPIDRLAYQALADQMSMRAIGNLARQAYGWRLHLNDPAAGLYSNNDKQWALYRNQLSLLVANYDCALKTDVVSCFASMRIDIVADELQSRVGASKIVERTVSMLKAWEHVPNRSGIPQRSLPSAMLANMVLSRIDDILEFHSGTVSSDGEARSFARWMDDVWIFGEDPGQLRSTQMDLQTGLQSLGLHMNTGKTQLLEGDEVAAQALNIEHSAVDGGFLNALVGKPIDEGPLNDLVERLALAKEAANRSSINFATKRMRDHRCFSKLDDLIDVAARMPHGADALARLFRAAGRAQDLVEWYLDYRSTPWAKLEWASAQLGTMFPSHENPGPRLVNHFASVLAAGGTSLPMTALCAQRLACWDAVKARVAIAEAVSRSDNPLQRRVLALAALHAQHNRRLVEQWLSEFEENAVTLEMLKDRNFKALKLVPDFEG